MLYTDAKPKGIVHFVGGAVVGAAPGLSYKHLVQRMAQGGYTVVQTSYPFTFSHQALALDLRRVRSNAVSVPRFCHALWAPG